MLPGGLDANREYLGTRIALDSVAPEAALPLYDPQTSGGLLISVAPERSGALVNALEKHGTPGFVVGEVVEGSGIRIIP